MPRIKYSKELLEPLVKNSLSVREVILKLGLKETGGNHISIKKKIDFFNIDRSHFVGQKANTFRYNIKGGIKSRLDQIFVYEKRIIKKNHETLRKALIASGVPYECVICGNKGEWQGKPLKLQVEHKDGDTDNNRKENLEFLCPNCHSQTPTWCRNKAD